MTTRPVAFVGLSLAVLVVLGGAACGSKGAPLPPLRPVPQPPAGLAARLLGDRVTLRMRVPTANADPSSELSISAVEIYARTLPLGSEVPSASQIVVPENLVGTIKVRPAPVAAASPDKPAPLATPPPAPTAKPTPTDPRPGPGDSIVWSETIPAGVPRPLELTRAQQTRVAGRGSLWMPMRPSGLSVPMSRLTLPARYYVVVGVSTHGRRGAPSAVATVPFGPPPAPPTLPVLTYTETTLTLTWPYRGPVTIVETTKGVEQPAPVQEAPIMTGSWSTPVTFGKERCFVVRRVIPRGTVSIESATVGPVCATPKDTFGPPAPAGLVAVSDAEGVTLLWEKVVATDLAGYLVLRGEGAGETLQQLTPKPIAVLQHLDTTARAGVRYVYYVVAVDAAGNQSLRSKPFNR